jgi:hypothetical protein
MIWTIWHFESLLYCVFRTELNEITNRLPSLTLCYYFIGPGNDPSWNPLAVKNPPFHTILSRFDPAHNLINRFNNIFLSHQFRAGIVSRYRYGLDGRGSIPGKGKIFLLSSASRPVLAPTHPSVQWVPGVKRQGREAGHSLPSSAEVNNLQSRIRLNGMVIN